MLATYSIIPIASGLLMAYLMSFSAVRLHIIPDTSHRKFWNVLLLIAFMVTATLGLLLAIQVNYKLSFSNLDKLMVFHVDFGIALATISIFHLSWHLKYYLKLFSTNSKHISDTPRQDFIADNKKPGEHIDFLHKLPVMALGATTIITQIVVLREFMAVFQGNELILGVILANWMFLTGWGAWLGKASPRLKNTSSLTFSFLLILGFLPILTIFLLHYLKNIVFVPGSLTGILEVFYSSGILLSPFCLLSGYAFSFFSFHLSRKYNSNLIRKVYAWEALGSVIGGAIVSLILIFFLKSMQVLALVLAFNASVALLLFKKRKIFSIKIFAVITGVILSLVLLIFPSDRFVKQYLFRNQKIILLKDTPYGSLAITESGDQHNFYENNILLTNTSNIIANEEDVHYALVQGHELRNILLISGGVSGVVSEILKYNVDRIDYVELNPWIIKAGKEFAPGLNNEKVNIITTDARRFLSKCSKKYDAVLINMPPPYTIHLNRFYTVEFFTELKTILNPAGLISFGIPASPNYSSTESIDNNSLIYRTLRSVFSNVIIVPGEKNYFISSESPLSLEITRLISSKGIENEYVSEYYIDDQLLKDRSDFVMSKLNTETNINTDLNPQAYFAQIRYWLSYNNYSTRILFILIGVIFIGVVIRLNPITAGMFAGGFAAASVQILLLFTFQLLFGYLYLMTGIIITVFMVGIALGALQNKWFVSAPGFADFIKVEISIGLSSFLLPLMVFLLKEISLPPVLEQFIYLLFTFAFSFLVGLLFSLASVLHSGKISRVTASIYGADLLGAALGALLVTGLLLPQLGMLKTTIIIGLVCILAASYSYAGKGKYQ